MHCHCPTPRLAATAATGLTSRPGVASVQQAPGRARSQFPRISGCCRCSVMSCCPWGLAGPAGAMNCNVLFFWPQLRPGGSTWLGSAGPAECHQPVDLEFAVLGCVCCYKCCAGACERMTIHRLRPAHVALRTGGSAWRARRPVASQTICPVGISCSDNHPQRGNHKDIQAGPRAQVSWAPLLCQAAFLRTSEHSHRSRTLPYKATF